MSKITLPPLPEGVAWMLSPNTVTTKRSHSTGKFPLYTAEQMQERDRQVVEHVIRACAEIAEALVTQHWQDYKRGPHRADPHYQGMSDGAQEVADAILALLEEPKE